MNCPSVGPSHGVQSFRNRLLQRGLPTGSQALLANLLWRELLSPQVCRSWQEPAPAQLPTGSQPPSGIHLLWRGVPSMGYRWRSAPPWTSTDCRGTTCLTMVFHHELQGKTLSSVISSTSSPSFFTDLGACRVVSLTSSHSSVFTAISPQFFSPLLKYVITEVLPLSLIGLALASIWSILEPAGTGFIRHEGRFLQLLTEAT